MKNELAWTCSKCGEIHNGLPDCLAYSLPDYPTEHEQIIAPKELQQDVRTMVEDGIQHYFIRGEIAIPVHGWEEDFAFGCWSSLSLKSYQRFVELWDSPMRTQEPPYFGYLANRIPYFKDTLSIHLSVTCVSVDWIPSFTLNDCEHPLYVAQRDGVSVERIIEWATEALHP